MSIINGLIFFFIVFINQSLYSQNWVQISSGTAQNLWGVDVVSSQNVYAVGDQGTIFFSSNGGNSWISQASGTTSFLNSVSFLNTSLGWAVGENGTRLYTNNGGNNWNYQYNGTGSSIGSIGFFNTQNFTTVAGAGEIYSTSDGGTSWNPNSPVTINNLWSIKVINTNIAYASGGAGTIIKTIDGGLSWSSLTSGVTDILWDIDFLDADIGYAVGDNGVILKTIDGGANWSAQTSGFVGSLYSVCVRNANTVYAVGVSGKILKTTDGVVNWVDEASGSTEALTRISFNGSTGIIVGQNGELLKYNVSLPTLSQITISNLTVSSVNLASNISSNGNDAIIQKGFVWSRNSNPTLSSNIGSINSGSGDGSFNSNISNLTPGIVYYARAYASNSEGDSYSDVISFTTLSGSQLPNNGDGNGDGIVDSLQLYVKTILTADGLNYITLEDLGRNELNDVRTTLDESNDNNYYYPYGFVEVKVNTDSTNIKIYYHNRDYFNELIYKKLNQNGLLINFNNFEKGFEIINGIQVATITLTLTDGGLGDYDGIVNGVIYDPGGPAIPITANIPIWDWWYGLLLIPVIVYSYKRFR